MVNDTAREEAETSIIRTSGPLSIQQPPIDKPERTVVAAAEVASPVMRRDNAKKVGTTELPPKCTSPTLVDFQPKHTMLPDWRLQLQNSVRMRSTGGVRELALTGSEARSSEPEPPKKAALKDKMSADATGSRTAEKNPMVANALRRIEESRKTFLPQEEPKRAMQSAPPQRNYPFNVVGRTETAPTVPEPAPVAYSPAPAAAPKPKLVSSLRIEKRGYDTNKLPPLPEMEEPAPSLTGSCGSYLKESPETEVVNEKDVRMAAIWEAEQQGEQIAEIAKIEDETIAAGNDAIEEYDDLAPFSMRFAAGLFDVIIGVIGTLIIVSPFISGGTWMSLSGMIAFTALLGIFLFLYLTASLSLWGKSFGMRIFSLELIDVDDNSTPTVHQAAVNSAVYLLSLALLGTGFLTALFNDDKRAAHDLVSGTIVIRELQ